MLAMCTAKTLGDVLEDCLPASDGGTCVSIGNFDGVHLGHQALLALAKKQAKGMPVVALTFDPHPLAVLSGTPLPRLTDTPTRSALLEAAGAELVVALEFTPELAAMSPEFFVEHLLVRRLRVKHLVLGYDFSLGKGRAGTPAVLCALGQVHGFAVHQMEALTVHGQTVSSTQIRENLASGATDLAAVKLGRWHSVRGTVIHGQKRGGDLLGFPTANLAPSALLLPQPGVYASLAALPPDGATQLPPPSLAPLQEDGYQVFAAVTNIGTNPTFGPGMLSVETHLLGVQRNLYGLPLEVAFVQRLRGEKPFAGPAALAAQIQQDIVAARQCLEGAVLPYTGL